MKRDIEQSDAILLEEILYILFRRKILIVALLIIAAGIFFYGIATEVDRYMAEAIVMIRRLAPVYAMPAESRQVLRREEVVNSEIEIITSPAVAEAVVDSLHLADGANRARVVNGIHRSIKAEAEPESNIIKISYAHPNPERAAEVVNAALVEYLRVRTRVALDYDAVAFLDKQAVRAKAKLDSLGNAIASFGAEGGQLSRGLMGEQQMNTISRLENELMDLDTSILTQQRTIDLAEEWLASGGAPSDAPNADIYSMQTYRDAKIRHMNLEMELEEARAKYAPSHPEIKRLERLLASSEQIVRREVEQGVERQRMRLEEWKARQEATRRIVEELRSENPQIAHDNLKIRILEHELEVRADLYGVIVDRREQFRITAATDPSLLNVGIVSRATVPVSPSKSGINMKSVFAFFTLVFGIALVFAVERMDQSLVRRVDVEREAGLKVLASIRYRPGR
ncbi:MAG: hypothetical protein JXB46_07585 [Candidatus Eisenbacteria bacterium]|nr:hypothetical protein [Candidatus Eisenbacteria bacterium]